MVRPGLVDIDFGTVSIRKEDSHLAAEGLADMRNGGLGDGLQVGGHGQVTAEFVQLDCFGFTALDRFGLAAHRGGQLADHDPDGQQAKEGEQVFGIGNCQGQVGGHEKVIKGGHPQDGSNDSRAAPQVDGCHDDRE